MTLAHPQAASTALRASAIVDAAAALATSPTKNVRLAAAAVALNYATALADPGSAPGVAK